MIVRIGVTEAFGVGWVDDMKRVAGSEPAVTATG